MQLSSDYPAWQPGAGGESGEDLYCRVGGRKPLLCLPVCGGAPSCFGRSGLTLHALTVQSLGNQNTQVSPTRCQARFSQLGPDLAIEAFTLFRHNSSSLKLHTIQS